MRDGKSFNYFRHKRDGNGKLKLRLLLILLSEILVLNAEFLFVEFFNFLSKPLKISTFNFKF